MDMVVDVKEVIEPELKTFTENRVKFSLKRLFWLVRKIKIRYSAVPQSKTLCNQNCLIELQTFDHQTICKIRQSICVMYTSDQYESCSN